MALNKTLVGLSAMIDLLRRGAIYDPMREDSKRMAIDHANAYLRGQVRFPLYTEEQAEIAVLQILRDRAQGHVPMDGFFSSIGNFFKDAVSDIGGFIKDAAGDIVDLSKKAIKYVVPVITGFVQGGPAGALMAGAGIVQSKLAENAQKKAQAEAIAQGMAAAEAERVGVIEATAVALAQRIALDPTTPAGSAKVAEYRTTLMAAKTQGELETITQQIVAQQDQAAAYQTGTGSTNAVANPNAIGQSNLLPILAVAGLGLVMMNKQSEAPRRRSRRSE